MTMEVDRRAYPRHALAADQTYLLVMDWSGRRITRARLLNISTGGALISTDRVIATSQRLMVRLENAADTDWVEAEVVRFERTHQVGIRFNSRFS